jgi:hypothetical protein
MLYSYALKKIIQYIVYYLSYHSDVYNFEMVRVYMHISDIYFVC